MEAIDFIEDLAIVMLAAGFLGILCKRIGLSVIVGYLAAGVAIGPYTPPFALIHDIERIRTLSELGLIFLMFSIGLELSLNKLKALGASMAIATGLGALLVFNFTQALGAIAGWSRVQTMFTAAMFMVSSSAVIAKMLRDLRMEHEPAGQKALGIAVLEDIVAIVMLTILGSYTKVGSAQDSGAISTVLTGLSGFVVLIVMGALLSVPRLLRRLQARADPELQTIVVAGVLFILALAAVWAGYSLALGAFLLGAVVAELPQRHDVEHAFVGLRDIFSSVFFVSIGMMIDVRQIAEVWPWILGLGAFVLVARPIGVGVALVLTGTPPKEARRAGLAVSPLGEFTFIIAQTGVLAGVLPATHYALAVGVSIVTVLVAPLINRHAGPLLRFAEKAEPAWLTRGLEVYHGWLTQLAGVPGHRLWWRRGRSHVIQLVIEALVVTGLLIFSETIYHHLEETRVGATLEGTSFHTIFGVILCILTLVPLVGMARSADALGRILAESTTSNRLRQGFILNTTRATALVLGTLWLSSLLPPGFLPAKAWWTLGAVVLVALVVFSGRIFTLRAQLHGSVENALSGGTPQAPVPQRWERRSRDWALNLQEIVIPDAAVCAGRTIAALGIRSRLGCTIVEINRQGFVLAGPEPGLALFPRDRLLALGTAEDLERARADLTRRNDEGLEVQTFNDAHLELVTVPENPHIAGQSLRDLRIPNRTGVVVVGIERDGRRQINPSGEEVLKPGDDLLVIGAAEELRSLAELLGSETSAAV
jgi:CPA2 family monovalent cation:H+ antiporter-2